MGRNFYCNAACLITVGLAVLIASIHAEPYWVPAMQATNASFGGEDFYVGKVGDSYAVSASFWHVFAGASYDLDDKAGQNVVDSMLSAASPYLPNYNSLAAKAGGSTPWLLSGNPSPLEQYIAAGGPEVSVVIIGTSDIGLGSVSNIPSFFYTNLTEIVDQLLASNSIPILTTLPPQVDRVHLVVQGNEVISMVASNKNVPLNDYYSEVIARQPTNWHGTLIAPDGIHPSSTGPAGVGVFTDDNLNTNGYALLNYTTLRTYAEVLEHVLVTPQGSPLFTYFSTHSETNISGGEGTEPPMPATTNISMHVDMTISNLTPFVGYRLHRSLDLLDDSGGWVDLGDISSASGVSIRMETASNEWQQVFYMVE